MTFGTGKKARTLVLTALVIALSGCALPRPGPSKQEIFAGSVQREGDAFVVTVNDHVTRATAVRPALGFGAAFRSAGRIGSDTIRPGDVLGLVVYENIEDGLLTAGLSGPAPLDEIQVDSSGHIFVPYAGRLLAAGKSPEELRRLLTRKLDAQTPDPQVQVKRLAGDGATVALMGDVGAEGVYPIERSTRTLSGMLARAGGVSIASDVAQITVVRGNRRGRVWLQDLYDHPEADIALRPDDRIIVEKDRRAFTALGATGAQSLVDFNTRNLSALEAIAQVGGLSSDRADPTGVFVFRNEPAETARRVLGRDDLAGTQRMVYVLDLTEPNGMFQARDFLIRDGDTVYVTEAPYVQWQKTLSALTGSVGTVSSVNSLANGS
ncbi:polysaccharide biosynthesis/export family protein [Rhodovulum sp. YNF3179]|uniref:polysaccharide biosynthesis/export family protein n=1 Tax=Rhodovulum sp. YNF3179 TaxID=3425127 RepID=UPI003D3333C8